MCKWKQRRRTEINENVSVQVVTHTRKITLPHTRHANAKHKFTLSKEPKVVSMALAMGPLGGPPAWGAMIWAWTTSGQ